MKKAISAAFIAALVLTSSLSQASLQQRLQWWEIRAKKLDEIKARFTAEHPASAPVLEVIEYERDAAREALSIFESYMGSGAGLTQTEREFSEKELADRTALQAGPLFSLLYFELLVTMAGEKNVQDETRRAVAQYIENLAQCPGCGIGETSREILTRDIMPEQWKILSVELLFSSFMNKKSAIMKDLEKSVTDSLVALVREKGKATTKQIDDAIFTETLAWMSGKAPAILMSDLENGLADSWCWRSMYSDLENWRTSCVEIRQLLPADETVSAARLKYLMKYIPELDALVFGQFGKDSVDAACAAVPGPDASARASLKARMSGLIADIDLIRKSRMQSVTGRESAEYFDALRKDLDATISRNLSADEKKHAGAAKAEGNGGMKDAVPSGEALVAATVQAKKYAETTRTLVAWLSRMRQRENAGILDLYRYRIDRNLEYTAYLKELVSRCPELASRDGQDVAARFTLAVNRSYNLIKFIESTVSPDRRTLSRMTAKEIISGRELKRDFHSRTTDTGLEISAQLQKFIRGRNEASRLTRFSDNDLKDKIAQYELDHFMDTARKCAELHGSLRYDEEALDAYRETFTVIKKEALAGNAVRRSDEEPGRTSLIPACPGFDEQRLKAETAAKDFLRRECEDALARVASLVAFYKRLGAAAEIAPESSDIEEIRSIISRHYTVRISAWTMDERNYREIDAKAFYETVRAARITAVRSQLGETTKSRPNRTVPVESSSLSFYLPGGWSEKKTGEIDKMKGMVSSFSNPLIDSSIYVVSVPGDGKSLQEVSGDWIKKEGMRLVRWKWIKKNDMEICWAIAGDGKSRIMETYALVRSDRVIIISGETDRGRRGEFSRTLGSLVDSMDF